MIHNNLVLRWIIKILLFGILVGVTCLILYIALPSNQNSYLAVILDKHDLLESTPGPRIIVVGGSNVAFGLDSELAANNLEMSVINYGLHGGLGMRFILNDLSSYLQPGDIVVISPEYENFYGNNFEGDDLTIALLADVFPRALFVIESAQFFRIPEILISMIRSRFEYFWTLLVYPGGATSDVYARASFNRFGDMVGHLGKKTSENIPDDAYISTDDLFNEKVIDSLNRFGTHVQSSGAKVVMIYPASRVTNCLATEVRFNELDARLRLSLEIPIFGQPTDFCYDDQYFFDTTYHLNAEGRQLHTDQLVDLLLAIP